MADDTKSVADDAAGTAQIEAAIEALRAEDHLRLDRAGQGLSQRSGRAAFGWGAEDLYQEAVMRTYDGRRRWCPGRVDFVRHLTETMRSIASEWRAQGRRGPVSLEPRGKGQPSRDPFDPTDAETLSAEERLLQHQECAAQIARLRDQFAGDAPVEYILMGLEDGLGRADILSAVGLTVKEYDAARNRLTRAASRWKPRGGGS